MKNIILAILTATAMALPAAAKIPGATHCHKDICHRVLTLAETEARIGRADLVLASHYGAPGRDRYNPRLETSSGEIFKPDRDDNVASPIFPDGTRLLLWNPASGHAVSVRVNNAGPYSRGRLIDTSEHVARKLGFYHQGVARIYAVVIAAPTPAEASYRRGRVYARVPGYLGRFEQLKLAMLADNAGVTALMRPGVHDDRIASRDSESLAFKNLAAKQPDAVSDANTASDSPIGLLTASRNTETPLSAPPAKPAAKPAPSPPARTTAIVRPRIATRPAATPAAAPRHEPRPSTTRCVFDSGPACS